MRVAVAMVHQETNSFCPVASGAGDFALVRGEAARARWREQGMPLAGMLAALAAAGAEVAPLLAGVAATAGPLAATDAAALRAEIVVAARAARPDAVLLDLHGALLDDAGGAFDLDLLQDLRRALGPAVWLGASLDSHANVTAPLAAAADLLVGYRTFPHVDQVETGRRAAESLLRLAGGPRPRVLVRRLPMLVPPEPCDTDEPPLLDLLDRLRQAEDAGIIFSGSLFYSQPWLDVPDPGNAVYALCAPERAAAAERLVREVAAAWWEARAAFVPTLLAPAAALARAERLANTVVLSESADSLTSGATGDNPGLLRALLARPALPAAVFLVDAPAVAAAHAAGPGARLRLALGGTLDPRFSSPVVADVEVERVGDGRFTLVGSIMRGVAQDMGGAAVLRLGATRLVVARRRVMATEPSLYRCLGVEPAALRVVGVKSPKSFVPNYRDMASAVFWLDLPGQASPNLATLPWRRLGRPVWPLDPMPDYDPRAG